MVVKLNGAAVKLPESFSQNLVLDALMEMPLAQLTGTKPMPLRGGEITVYTGNIEAGYVEEGEAKPIANPTSRLVTLQTKKLASIVIFSDEFIHENPNGLVEAIAADMKAAIGRAATLAVIHGKSTLTGAAIPGVSFINQTTNRVKNVDPLDGSHLQAAFDLVDNATQFADVDSVILAPSQRFNASKLGALPVAQQPAVADFKNPVSEIGGLRTVFAKGTDGRLGAAAATDTVGFVGDFARGVQFGYARDIDLSTTNQASIVDSDGNTINLWQRNLTAFRVEATIGWMVLPELFAALDKDA